MPTIGFALPSTGIFPLGGKGAMFPVVVAKETCSCTLRPVAVWSTYCFVAGFVGSVGAFIILTVPIRLVEPFEGSMIILAVAPDDLDKIF